MAGAGPEQNAAGGRNSISIRDSAFQALTLLPTDAAISDAPRLGTHHSDTSQPASNQSVANLGSAGSAATTGAMAESTPVTGSSRYPTQSVHVQAEGEAPAVTTPMCPAVTTPTRRFPLFPDGTIGYINEGDYAHMPFHVSSLTSDHYTVAWGDGSAVEKHASSSRPIHQYVDDNPTNTPEDRYTIKVTAYNICGNSASAQTRIRVKHLAPHPKDDLIEVFEYQFPQIGVLANDTDPGHDDLSVKSINTTGTIGKVTLDTATNTIKYDPNNQFDHLNPGDTATDTFDYTVRDDDTGESTASVSVTINGTADRYRVSIVLGDPVAKEVKSGAVQDNGEFSVVVDKPVTDAPLTVSYTIATGTGYAENGVDYARIPSSVTIPVGSTRVDIPISVINDLKVEGLTKGELVNGKVEERVIREELVLLALESSGDYVQWNFPQASVATSDNDQWDWTTPFVQSGQDLNKGILDTKTALPHWNAGPFAKPAFAYAEASTSHTSRDNHQASERKPTNVCW